MVTSLKTFEIQTGGVRNSALCGCCWTFIKAKQKRTPQLELHPILKGVHPMLYVFLLFSVQGSGRKCILKLDEELVVSLRKKNGATAMKKCSMIANMTVWK